MQRKNSRKTEWLYVAGKVMDGVVQVQKIPLFQDVLKIFV